MREVLPKFDDAAMAETWRLMAGEQEVSCPTARKSFLRDVMFSHWYQHRGQFSVYLRLLNIAGSGKLGTERRRAAGLSCRRLARRPDSL